MLHSLDERRHRDARDDVRRHRVHGLARDQARLRHQLELRPRLHAPQLVDERRALFELRPGHRREQLDHRLRPDPLPERDPPWRADLAHGLRERLPTVPVLADDEGARRRDAVEVEGDDHARQHVDRLLPRRQKCARDPAVRVGDLAEGRQVALDPRQVLEIRSGRDKERVEAATGEQLTEPLAPSRVLVRVDCYPAATQYAAEPRAGHSRSGSAR